MSIRALGLFAPQLPFAILAKTARARWCLMNATAAHPPGRMRNGSLKRLLEMRRVGDARRQARKAAGYLVSGRRDVARAQPR
jgi:hypothetical protein